MRLGWDHVVYLSQPWCGREAQGRCEEQCLPLTLLASVSLDLLHLTSGVLGLSCTLESPGLYSIPVKPISRGGMEIPGFKLPRLRRVEVENLHSTLQFFRPRGNVAAYWQQGVIMLGNQSITLNPIPVWDLVLWIMYASHLYIWVWFLAISKYL